MPPALVCLKESVFKNSTSRQWISVDVPEESKINISHCVAENPGVCSHKMSNHTVKVYNQKLKRWQFGLTCCQVRGIYWAAVDAVSFTCVTVCPFQITLFHESQKVAFWDNFYHHKTAVRVCNYHFYCQGDILEHAFSSRSILSLMTVLKRIF